MAVFVLILKFILAFVTILSLGIGGTMWYCNRDSAPRRDSEAKGCGIFFFVIGVALVLAYVAAKLI